MLYMHVLEFKEINKNAGLNAFFFVTPHILHSHMYFVFQSFFVAQHSTPYKNAGLNGAF